MTDTIRFTLDGREVEAPPARASGRSPSARASTIPHLCWLPEPGYRADGNCRACMVEVEGERVLAASCIRKPTAGMKVTTAIERAVHARTHGHGAAARRPAGARRRARPSSRLWDWAERMGVDASRFPAREQPRGRLVAPGDGGPARRLHPVQPLRARLPRGPGQRRHRHGLPRPHEPIPVFDQDDPMGDSTCVACGECVQACPTGALMPARDRRPGHRPRRRAATTARSTASARICGVGCQITYHVKDDEDRLRHRPRRPGEREPALRQGPLRLRLRPQPAAADQAADPPEGAPKGADDRDRPAQPAGPTSARRAGRRRWTRPPHGLRSASATATAAMRWPASARPSAATRRPTCSRSWSAPASAPTMSTTAPACATPRSVAALMEGIGTGAVTAPFNDALQADLVVDHRRQPDREPPGGRDLLQAGGQARHQARRHGPARHGDEAPRHAGCCSSSPAATSPC